MRAAVYLGLLLCSVAFIADVDGASISFDDLAEQAEHPPPAKEPERPDLEMEEWSTDHLLGLDAPPPSDMFDSLLGSHGHEAEREEQVRKPHKVHRRPAAQEQEVQK